MTAKKEEKKRNYPPNRAPGTGGARAGAGRPKLEEGQETVTIAVRHSLEEANQLEEILLRRIMETKNPKLKLSALVREATQAFIKREAV